MVGPERRLRTRHRRRRAAEPDAGEEIGRSGAGDVHLRLHAVRPGDAGLLPASAPCSWDSTRRDELEHQPRAERRTDLLPRQPLPRPPRGRADRLRRRGRRLPRRRPRARQHRRRRDTSSAAGPDATTSTTPTWPRRPTGVADHGACSCVERRRSATVPRRQRRRRRGASSTTSTRTASSDRLVTYRRAASRRSTTSRRARWARAGATSTPRTSSSASSPADDDPATPGEVDMGAYIDAVPHAIRYQALDCPVGAAVGGRVPALPTAARRCRRLHLRPTSARSRRSRPRSTPTARSGRRRCGTCAPRSARRSRARSSPRACGSRRRADLPAGARRDHRARTARYLRRRATTPKPCGRCSPFAAWVPTRTRVSTPGPRTTHPPTVSSGRRRCAGRRPARRDRRRRHRLRRVRDHRSRWRASVAYAWDFEGNGSDRPHDRRPRDDVRLRDRR